MASSSGAAGPTSIRVLGDVRRFFGAFLPRDVRTLTFCQLMGFPQAHEWMPGL